MTQANDTPSAPAQPAASAPPPVTQHLEAGAGALSAQVANSQNVNIYFGNKRLLATVLPAPSPGQLSGLQWLMPQSRATALVGREAERADLRLWLEDPRPTLLRCITGAGGRGKTRFGIEACTLALGLGYVAGFARGETLDAIASADGWLDLVQTQASLVVIDYAASRKDAINAWLGALAENAPRPHKLRILLLERHANTGNGWYSELFTGGYSSYGKRALFSPPEPIELPGLHSAEQRRAVLQELLDQLPQDAKAAPLPNDAAFNTQLANNPDAGDPLWLMMLAFALHSGAAHPRSSSLTSQTRQGLALEIAKIHEAPRIAALAKSAGLHPQFALYLCACVTLMQGYPSTALAELADAEMPLLHIKGAGGFDQAQLIATALGETGSGDQQEIQAIGPDLIGEAFVLHVLDGTFSGQTSAALLRLQARAPLHVSQSLVRLAQDFGALNEGACSLGWQEQLVEQLPADGEALAALDAVMPCGSTALRPFNLLAARKLAFGRAATHSEELRAGRLINLAIAEAEMGNREAALAAAQQAVTLYRQLARMRPDAFAPDLAGSLIDLAALLSAVGQREAALDAAVEAVALHRVLIHERQDAFRPNLAASLNNLANRLGDLGQREAALAAAHEAADLQRQLAQQRPDAFTSDLAMSLNNLAGLLSAVGQREAALAAAREAVTLYEQLTQQRPDAFTPDLAMSLNSLAIQLSALGQREAALGAALEAADLYRRLAQQHPEPFTPELAMSLNNLANRLRALGQRQAALAAAHEAVALRRGLAQQRPEAFTQDLAMSLTNLASHLSELDERVGALAAAHEAAYLYRLLAQQRSDAFTPEFAAALINLAGCLSELGQPEAALAAAQEATNLYRQLAQQLPDTFTPGLAASLNNLAALLSDLGQREAALDAGQESVDLRRLLAQQRPDAFTADLAKSLMVLALRTLEAGGESGKADACALACQLAAEAIAKLSPHFVVLPQAHAGLMRATIRNYLGFCEAAGLEPDADLLDPLTPVFKRLKNEE